jgi:hypothetical protein
MIPALISPSNAIRNGAVHTSPGTTAQFVRPLLLASVLLLAQKAITLSQ